MKSSLTDQSPANDGKSINDAYDEMKFIYANDDQDISPPPWLGYGLIAIIGCLFAFMCWLLIRHFGG